MGRTACTEPQCLYKGALYLTSVPVQGYPLSLPYILSQQSNKKEKERYIQITEFWYMTSSDVEHGTEISEGTAASVFMVKEPVLLN